MLDGDPEVRVALDPEPGQQPDSRNSWLRHGVGRTQGNRLDPSPPRRRKVGRVVHSPSLPSHSAEPVANSVERPESTNQGCGAVTTTEGK